MRLLPRTAPLPLLARDLTELAARRRTYVMRMLYAAGLFLCFMVFFHEAVSDHFRSGGLYAVLGLGRQAFTTLIALQFAGVYLFLPAMMCGALTAEKERNTLQLLFVTDLRPWEILLQKFAGHLVPMLSCLLLGLPLLAVCYAFGGLSPDYLASGILLLMLAVLQVGAATLMMSSFCATRAQAFLGSYLLLTALYFGWPIMLGFLALVADLQGIDESTLFLWVPPAQFADAAYKTFGTALLRSIPAMLTTLLFLGLARVFLLRRAFVSSSGVVVGVFRKLDVFWRRANKLIGGIILIKEPDTLPGSEPVRWRETAKKSLGKPSHLIRILCLLGIPVILLVSMQLYAGGLGRDAVFCTLAITILWVVGGLTVVVSHANAFASERASGTLDVLLATPLTGREIVRQKVRARRRLLVVIGSLMLLVVLFEAWMEADDDRLLYLVSSALSVAVYLPMFSWVSTWVGLRMRGSMRTMVAAVLLVVIWCVAPWVFGVLLEAVSQGAMERPPGSLVFMFSPGTAVALTEIDIEVWEEVLEMPIVAGLALNYVLYAGILLVARWRCLAKADDYLGRATEG